MTPEQYERWGDLCVEVDVNGLDVLEDDEVAELALLAVAIRTSMSSTMLRDFQRGLQ